MGRGLMVSMHNSRSGIVVKECMYSHITATMHETDHDLYLPIEAGFICSYIKL